MTSKYIRSLALLLCAALLSCLLAACGGAASSSPASSAAPASDSASASGSSELPSSTTEANTGELNPGNFDENSVFSITGTENAFAPCLGWGPGVSGCSLKSVIAAASLLHWAEDARMSTRSPEAIQDAFYSWYDGLTDNQQEGFAEAWPLIKDAALDLLSDKDSMTGRITDAGLDADTLPGCTLKTGRRCKACWTISCRRRTARLKRNFKAQWGADRVVSAPFCLYTFFSTYWRVPMPTFSACSRVAFHSMLGLESLKLSW